MLIDDVRMYLEVCTSARNDIAGVTRYTKIESTKYKSENWSINFIYEIALT
jgi:hypothetical protein